MGYYFPNIHLSNCQFRFRFVNVMQDIIEFNVGGTYFATTLKTISVEKSSYLYNWYIEHIGGAHLLRDKKGIYFIDRDPASFAVILNYLRLRVSNQLWEACLPKDPDLLAMVAQEADYFRIHMLRDQAIALLQNYTEKGCENYVKEVLSKSFSCPQGFPKDDED
ncbi:BTB/POZ-like domain and Potassium channel tetramerisation-type BTB domain and BTB/POZ fold domain-containing protein [Strongyloides ratti]|uniref:BTB/POZ-like domain and Potassium channel tetramerisation-type BTB domain and BTB/POZ fold domain-containing protein n=1 Tax=Strongyloides ratti TaxID=34506 RepID=A0A090KZ75_STRRB|nr:BTB/POZ-like domain and Potassium channel tetramerisation-type BTB domain and BTB/POZ fold domain-containing protein [Strongyloides ratti]CEF60539.1 BTB/POZ-like domain and Potassium channel tetramerisation-type BTB domain and BTB/POZ fold domain-containing protein [Strongyloides ratti]